MLLTPNLSLCLLSLHSAGAPLPVELPVQRPVATYIHALSSYKPSCLARGPDRACTFSHSHLQVQCRRMQRHGQAFKCSPTGTSYCMVSAVVRELLGKLCYAAGLCRGVLVALWNREGAL